MKPRVSSFALQAELVSLLVGFLYFALVAPPALRGESGVAAVVADSLRFHALAKAEDIQGLFAFMLGWPARSTHNGAPAPATGS